MTRTTIRFVTDVWREDCQPGDAEYYDVNDGPQTSNYTGKIVDGVAVVADTTPRKLGGIMFRCPGCNRLGSISFVPPCKWEWDGNREKPTCTPSILHDKDKCGWHGFLTKGVFEG